jgi:hypothetical protein
MNRIACILLCAAASLLAGPARPAPDLPATDPATQVSQVHFAWVDVFVDPGGRPLAAYQFELKARGAGVTLVGVEGGEHPAYAEPPFYDPRANLHNRIVIAAFNTGDDLPKTRTRVARVMVRVNGPGRPQYSASIDVAASTDARPIDAAISVTEGAAP